LQTYELAEPARTLQTTGFWFGFGSSSTYSFGILVRIGSFENIGSSSIRSVRVRFRFYSHL